MEYKCEIVETKDQPVLSIRTRTRVQDLPPLIGQAYGKIMARMAELAVEAAGNPFVAYYNLNMEDLDVELGFPVDVKLEGKGGDSTGLDPWWMESHHHACRTV